MKIEHLALWVANLESMKSFYETYFGGKAGELYVNPRKQFHSYFITFEATGSRLELMTRPDITPKNTDRGYDHGLAHFAVSVGSKTEVDQLTERLRTDGFIVAGEPRTTGDGYYESVVRDPEGNLVEITI